MELFKKCSGLKFNRQKTEAIPLGNLVLPKDFDVVKVTKKPVKILGIYFSTDKSENDVNNFDRKLSELESLISIWNRRNLSLVGKINIIRSLAIPKIMYSCNMLAIPKHFVKKAESIIYRFLWNGKDKIKRNVIIQEYENAGLKMPDISSMIKANRISWVKRLLDDDSEQSWKNNFDAIFRMLVVKTSSNVILIWISLKRIRISQTSIKN